MIGFIEFLEKWESIFSGIILGQGMFLLFATEYKLSGFILVFCSLLLIIKKLGRIVKKHDKS